LAFARYLIIALLFICGLSELKAEDNLSSEDGMGLERIVVTNRRAGSSLSRATENIIVVTSEQIKELPARNLSEVLNYIPGVDIPPGRGFGRATSISIQGSDSRQVRVMIDGIPLNTQSSGQVNPAEFPLENIERIEVIKGPASSLWGSGLGGVINIITKDTGTTLAPKGSVTVSFAEFRTQKESAELSGKLERLGYYVFSSYMESGGSGPRDDVFEKKAYGKLSYDMEGAGRMIASFGYSGAEVNSGRFPDGAWQSQPYRDRYGKVGWENDLGATEARVEFKHFRKDIVTKDYNSVDNLVLAQPLNRNKDALYQLSINTNTRFREDGLLVMGADFDNDSLKSSAYLSKAKSVRLYAPYANYALKLGRWDLNAGLRYDYNSEFGEEASPSLGAAYHFKNMPGTTARFAVARAFNAPPLLWKFNQYGSLIANPELGPERAWVYEAGIESELSSRLWCKFSVYRSEVKEAISSFENDAGQTYMKNFQKFRRQGAGLEGRLRIFEELHFTAAAAFNDIEDRSTKETVRGGGKPRQSFNLALEYKNKKGLMFSLLGYYNRWNEPASYESNDRKMLLDFKVSRDWKNIGVFLNIYNLNNSKYWSDYYYPAPQRYFEGGLTLKW
jgi:vitamin B12 transporter